MVLQKDLQKKSCITVVITLYYALLAFFAPFTPHQLNMPFIKLIPDASAEEPLSPKQIAQKAFDRDRGENSRATAQMVLVNSKDDKRTREFESLRIKQGKLETQMIRFLSPADIRGTGFLTVENEGWKNDQFLYLPALRRSRRIVSSQKSNSFVNSDFSYEDMERHPVDDYSYIMEGDTTINSLPCYIITSRPNKGTESQYSMVKSHIIMESFVTLLMQFFDKKGSMIKQYKVMKLEKIQNIWTESTIMMEDIQKKQKTYINIQKIEYNTNMNRDELSQQSLENF